MKKTLVLIIMVGMLLSCSRKENTNAHALVIYQESMKIHDEIMPRMDEIYTLETKLKALRDSLFADSIINARKISTINDRLVSLETSGKSMMDWMHNIQNVPGAKAQVGYEHYTARENHGDMAEAQPEEILKVQQDQKSKIELVKAAMEKSITEAKKTIQLNSVSIRVIRFENRLVFDDTEYVLTEIKKYFLPPRPSDTPS